MNETTKLAAPSGAGVDAVVKGCVAKRIVARIDGITTAGGLIAALKQLQLEAETDPYVMGHGERYAGIALELTCDSDDGEYEIAFRADP